MFGGIRATVKPVNSLFRHDPEEGSIGDCHRAVIASLMEMRAEEVPHFFDYPVDQPSDKGLDAANKWLSQYGLFHLGLPMKADSLEEALKWAAVYSAKLYYTLTALSKAGNNHIVVCKGKRVVHDPTFGKPHGIVGPAKDGYWWLGWLASTQPETQWSRDVA